MIKNKNILLADIGATNARLAINQEKGRYKYSEERRVNDFKSIEELFSSYLDNINMTGLIRQAVIGVAAPIVSDRVSFVNCPISFSQKNLKNKFFSEGLIVLNDLELQAHAISNLSKEELKVLSQGRAETGGSKILVVPGTGLGLSGIIEDKVCATEAGHLYIPSNLERFSPFTEQFKLDFHRVPTFEDLLSAKGIIYLFKKISGSRDEISSKEIMENFDQNKDCKTTRELYIHILTVYLRIVSLVWGATGGVYIAGSIAKTIAEDLRKKGFREEFENSDTMYEMLSSITIYLITINDLGLRGAAKCASFS